MISVVIPTLNRPNLLQKLLLDLENQIKKPDQIVVVDSSEPKNQINKTFFSSISIPVTYEQSNIKSAAIQRNIGLNLVNEKCQLLAFLDDDISINEHYFEVISRHFDDFSIVGISGLAINPKKVSQISKLFFLKRLFYLDSKYEGTITRGGINIPFKNLSVNSDLRESEWLIGCSVWRAAKIRQLRFNDKFLGQSLFEDVIFSLKAAKFGKLYVDCGLYITHYESNINRPNFFDFYKMWVFNRYSVVRLLKKKKFSNLAFHWTNFGKLIQLTTLMVFKPKENLMKLKGFYHGYCKLIWENLKKYHES